MRSKAFTKLLTFVHIDHAIPGRLPITSAGSGIRPGTSCTRRNNCAPTETPIVEPTDEPQEPPAEPTDAASESEVDTTETADQGVVASFELLDACFVAMPLGIAYE